MRNATHTHSFITDLRVRFAVNLANETAEKNHRATAYECADQAVLKIFGRWLLDYSGAVKPELMPIYLRLVCDVEQRLGLHRRRKTQSSPLEPAQATWPISPSNTETTSAPAVMAA